jgi:hypothetical protein
MRKGALILNFPALMLKVAIHLAAPQLLPQDFKINLLPSRIAAAATPAAESERVRRVGGRGMLLLQTMMLPLLLLLLMMMMASLTLLTQERLGAA